MQLTIGVGVNTNHFKYWSSKIHNVLHQYLTHYLFYTKNAKDKNLYHVAVLRLSVIMIHDY
jgi:hypothetical protein